MGNHVTWEHPAEVPGKFVLEYQNNPRFGRDLTVSVDSAVARLRQDDPDVKALLRSYLRPGYNVIRGDTGIILPEQDPVFYPGSREFHLNGTVSEWVTCVSPCYNPFITFLFDNNRELTYRWRGGVTKGYARFNALTPREVEIVATFFLEIQAVDGTAGRREYKGVPVSELKIKDLATKLSEDITIAYRDYLKTLGIKVIPP